MKNAIILGSGRSGTSLVAGMLAKSGYFMGPNLMQPTLGNPKGYFESFEIEKINEEILGSVIPAKPKYLRFLFKKRPGKGHYWLTVLGTESELEISVTVQKKIGALTKHRPYCFKDPRFCYTLPVWMPLLEHDTIFICVFRHPSETAASMIKEVQREPYLKNYDFDLERAYMVWKHMYLHVLNLNKSSRCLLFLHYQQLLSNEGPAKIEAFTGAQVDRNFADRSLNRSKGQKPISQELSSIYQKLCNLAGYNLE